MTDRVVEAVLRRIYAARGVTDAAEFEAGLDRLLAPGALLGLPAAAQALSDAIDAKERICVIGDYDADGATGTALALRGLTRLGATTVDYLIPDRATEGYGLTPAIVDRASRSRPVWLVTVDNGINSVEGADAAARRGMRLIITDHHLPGSKPPQAVAIVNPNQSGDPFASKALSGVGVVLYLLIAIRRLRRLPTVPLADLLDLVALGTVADCVPLDMNNRLLVRHGLRCINGARANPGIEALVLVSGRRRGDVTAQDLGFQLGPRLNAAGRLADMAVGVRLLLTDDRAEAMNLAVALDALNRERRAREGRMQAEAHAALAPLALAGTLPAALCVVDSGWHPGIVGILAARLKDRYQRPVIALAPGDDGLLRGSGRSVPTLNLRDALAAMAEAHPRLFIRFGGHAAAAGLTIAAADQPLLASAFASEVARRLGPPPYSDRRVDGALAVPELTVALAQALRIGGPWGNGFPEPVFTGCFTVESGEAVSGGHWRLVLRMPGREQPIKAMAFGRSAGPTEGTIEMDYRLGVDDYRGRSQLCLYVEAWHDPVGATTGLGYT
ncbi:MAG: single-stranded-DNA-specific exonuclease RecJ [Acidiferrobacter sp.]